ELDGLDPAEVLLAEGHRRSGAVERGGLEEIGHLVDQLPDDVDRLDVLLSGHLVEELAQIRRDEGEHHHRAGLGGLAEHLGDGVLVAHARKEADPHPLIRELEQRGPNDPLGRLAGGVAHHEDRRAFHRSTPHVRATVNTTPAVPMASLTTSWRYGARAWPLACAARGGGAWRAPGAGGGG